MSIINERLETYNALFSIIDDKSDIINTAVMESISMKERKELKDEDFGIPELRKYPINNAKSVENAIKFFKFVKEDYREKLAERLLEAAKKYEIKIEITSDNPITKYIDATEYTIVSRKKKNKIKE